MIPVVDLRKKTEIGTVIRNNAVTIMFILLCIVCLYFSGLTVPYVLYELFGRLSRNAFIVLALILPIVAGMGINFAVTIGAMAAQIAVLWVTEWGVGGIEGFLLAMAMSLPIAAVFGFLIGGATTSRCKISHVLIGTFLFQGVLTLGMPVANVLVPGSTISETLRILISNGIILYALTKSGGASRG